MYAILRLRACVKYIVHIDEDILLDLAVPTPLASRNSSSHIFQKRSVQDDWMWRAIHILRHNRKVFAVQPMGTAPARAQQGHGSHGEGSSPTHARDASHAHAGAVAPLSGERPTARLSACPADCCPGRRAPACALE